jgi:hypothetical protein
VKSGKQEQPATEELVEGDGAFERDAWAGREGGREDGKEGGKQGGRDWKPIAKQAFLLRPTPPSLPPSLSPSLPVIHSHKLVLATGKVTSISTVMATLPEAIATVR